ncbi:beta strand repeat-containing protein, partial [Thermodesulfobacteriota bacterium]
MNISSLTDATGNDVSLTAATGDILIDYIGVGTVSGNISLSAADGLIGEVPTEDPEADLVAGTLNLISATGIGSLGQLEIDVTTLTHAEVTGSGAINLMDTAGGLLVTIATTADGSVNIGATDGNLVVTTVTALGNNRDVALSTLSSGNIRVGNVSAANDTIILTSAGAIEELGPADTAADITTLSIALRAATGIGSLGALETSVSLLAAFNSDSGHILISNSVGGLLTIGTFDGLAGITHTGTGNGNIVLHNAGPLAVSNDVINSAGGDITLTSTNDGNEDDHLIIDARVIASGGDGSVFLNAGTDLIVNDSTQTPDISTVGAGMIVGIADRDVLINDGVTIQSANGVISFISDDGDIVMADGTTTTSGTGLINYNATGSVALSLLTTGGNVQVMADAGAITDNTALENANIVADQTTLSAATGIGASGAADIDTTITTLTATNRISGDIFIQETDGLIVVGTGARILGGSGSIDIDADAGVLTVSSLVTANGDGNVTLNADAGAVTLEAMVSSTSGDIVISGDGIVQNAGVDVTTGDAVSEFGTVKILADNGDIVMADGTTTAAGTGLISYSATGSVALSLLTTGGNVQVTADSGAITDNTALENANIVADQATLSAATGIGASGAADIDTTITTLIATNSTSGDIFVEETDDLIISGTGVKTESGNGSIVLITQNGSLTISEIVSADGSGNILLQADSTGSVADISLNADVTSGTGSITILAHDNVEQNAGADVITSTGSIDVEATNGAIVMTDTALASSVGGNIRFSAKTDNTLGGINAGTGSVSVIAETGNIIDGGNTYKDVIADSLRMVAGKNIGSFING